MTKFGFRRILFIVLKNLKIVFRSWTSILLLILGPMILILILGFAFNGDDLHDINMGVYAKDMQEIQPVLENIASDEVRVVMFKRLDFCIWSMNHSFVHLCAEFDENFNSDPASGEMDGTITFYYDNSRYNLIRFILDYLKEKIDITSEEISLQASEQIINDVQEFVGLMVNTQKQLGELKTEAMIVRSDLVEMRDQLLTVKKQFDPRYEQIKELQGKLNDSIETLEALTFSEEDSEKMVNALTLLNGSLDTSYYYLNASYTEINDTIVLYNDAVDVLKSYVLNLSLPMTIDLDKIKLNHSLLDRTLDSLDSSQELANDAIAKINNTNMFIDSTIDDIEELKEELDLLIVDIDAVNDLINNSIKNINENIVKIDDAIIEIDRISIELNESIEQLSGIDQDQAEMLINPINAEFEPILGDLAKIYLIFPILLVFIITFISILLSNMVVLNEIHSPAFFRNFLVPINNLYYIVGLFITNMIVVLIQIAVLLLVSYFNFGIDIMSVFFSLMIAVLLVTTVFVLIGMFFAYLIRIKQTSILVCTFFALGVFLFSDVIFPVEIMPKTAAFFANLNPLLIGENIFRKIIFFDIGLLQQYGDIGILLVYIVLLFCGTVGAYYVNKKKS